VSGDAALFPAPHPSVFEIAPGPLGPRFRVRGLRNNPALAAWLSERLNASSAMLAIASADSGTVRFDLRRARDADVAHLARTIERALDSFGLRPAVRSRQLHNASSDHSGSEAGLAGPHPSASPLRPKQSSASASIQPRTEHYHHGPMSALMKQLDAHPSGLSSREAAVRLRRDGPNEMNDIAARSDLAILASQFKSLPVALLASSGLLALATGGRADAAAIAAVLAANSGIGYVTERHAEQTVSALRKLAPGTAWVMRDDRKVEIKAREVVVGDVLLLRPGDQVPADARVLTSHRLSANEAPLTGESLPVHKQPSDALASATLLGERTNMLHMGTVIAGGAGTAVVVATATRTALGGIRALAQQAASPRTRMQEELDGLGKRLGLGAVGLCLGLIAIGLVRGRPALPLVRTAVALGVAAIPEGLPSVATSLLAAGIRTLRQRNVYARSLEAIENLGAVNVVGFDKTGTLTENRMRVASVMTGLRRVVLEGNDKTIAALPEDYTLVCALCSDVERTNGNGWRGSSTEVALVDLVLALGVDVRKVRTRYRRLEAKERSLHHPYMVTLHAEGRARMIVAMKGRPPEVLERCTRWFDGSRVTPLKATQRKRLLKANDMLAASGERVLALAIKRQPGHKLDTTGDMTWLGLVGLSDPIRPGIAASIARFHKAGIRPLMLTGDQMGTARSVARAIGLSPQEVADAGTLREDARALEDVVERHSAFGRSSPGMKLHVIRALQANGHVVAMTGDGINDGPALKAADVGVAMGKSGTDFAQAMSDLVLQDDHPDGLLAAIAEGRTSYLNVKKAVRYLVATNVSELALVTLSVAAGLPDPLDPLALLWTNLITDVSPAIALGLEPPEPDVLERPPFRRTKGLLDKSDWIRVGIDGGLITAAAAVAYLYALVRYGPSPRARTVAFMALTTAQLVYALSARSEVPLNLLGPSRLRRNPWLTATVTASLAAQTATVLLPPLRRLLRTTPIGLADAALIAAAAAAPSLVREIMKRTPPRRTATAAP
jgi:Ca2+-transporting ATPase